MTRALGRFFIDGVYREGERVELVGEDARKLRVVLRARVGERIELRDSSSTRFSGTIMELEPGVTVELGEARRDDTPELAISLAQALPKGSKMDYVVEKATELGVREILPVQSARVIGERERGGRVERWRRIARSAAEQSGARAVPEIGEALDWSGLVARFSAYDRVVVPWELAPAEPRSFERLLTDARSLLVVIGPEGGLTEHEVAAAVEAGATAVSLGRRILRTETAALVAISIARYAAGEV